MEPRAEARRRQNDCSPSPGSGLGLNEECVQSFLKEAFFNQKETDGSDSNGIKSVVCLFVWGRQQDACNLGIITEQSGNGYYFQELLLLCQKCEASSVAVLIGIVQNLPDLVPMRLPTPLGTLSRPPE